MSKNNSYQSSCTTINEILAYNHRFVERGDYRGFAATKRPRKHLAIVSCMDTRLTTLLPAALGLKNGDVHMVSVAGAEVTNAFDPSIRSLLIAVGELGVTSIMVIAHSDCGAQQLKGKRLLKHLKALGASRKHIACAKTCGIDMSAWLQGFKDTKSTLCKSVAIIRSHPALPKSVVVEGFIIDSDTGQLYPVAG